MGYEHVFMPLLLKHDPTVLRCLLWAIHEERSSIPAPPPAGRVSFEVTEKLPREYYLTAGYALFKNLAIRLDMLDRLAGLLRKASRGLLEPEAMPAQPADTPLAVEPEKVETPTVEADEKAVESTQTTETSDTSEEVTSTPAVEPSVEATPAQPETEEASAPSAETKPLEEKVTDAKPAQEATAPPKQNAKKKDLPRNLPFKPTHEMLSLVGTTKEQFTLILDQLGYEARGEGDELTYRKAPFKKRKSGGAHAKCGKPAKGKSAPRKGNNDRPSRPNKPKAPEFDPNSPFAVLKNLKTK